MNKHAGTSTTQSPLQNIPKPDVLFRSFSFWVWVSFAILIIDAIPDYFVQYWFNLSLGYQSIFWTNFWMQFDLFAIYVIAVATIIYLPMRLYAKNPMLRKSSIHFGIWISIIAGWLFAHNYLQYLLAFNGVPFGEADPVFGNDIGFYIYLLPAWRISLNAFEIFIL